MTSNHIQLRLVQRCGKDRETRIRTRRPIFSFLRTTCILLRLVFVVTSHRFWYIPVSSSQRLPMNQNGQATLESCNSTGVGVSFVWSDSCYCTAETVYAKILLKQDSELLLGKKHVPIPATIAMEAKRLHVSYVVWSKFPRLLLLLYYYYYYSTTRALLLVELC